MGAMTTYRAVVDPAHCDFLGHMNVSRYFAACSDGVFAIQCAMGLDRADMSHGRRLSFAVVHAESDFRAEIVSGEAIHLETEIVDIGQKSMTFRHRLKRSCDDALAFETVFKCVMLSLESRAAHPIPDDVRQRAAQWRSDAAG